MQILPISNEEIVSVGERSINYFNDFNLTISNNTGIFHFESGLDFIDTHLMNDWLDSWSSFRGQIDEHLSRLAMERLCTEAPNQFNKTSKVEVILSNPELKHIFLKTKKEILSLMGGVSSTYYLVPKSENKKITKSVYYVVKIGQFKSNIANISEEGTSCSFNDLLSKIFKNF